MDGACFFSQRHVLLWWGEATSSRREIVLGQSRRTNIVLAISWQHVGPSVGRFFQFSRQTENNKMDQNAASCIKHG